MRVGIIQSNYIPWLGYFDFIASVDTFVFLDDVQYTTRDWRNRNLVRMHDGMRWLTVPVRKHPRETPIDHIEIDGQAWRDQHGRAFEQSFGKAPFYRNAYSLWCVATHGQTMLSKMNQDLIRSICAVLQIRTEFVNSRMLGVSGAKTERLLQILNALGADTYLSGPSARDYLDERLLNDKGIRVEWMRYQNRERVTVLEAIAHHGQAALVPQRKAA